MSGKTAPKCRWLASFGMLGMVGLFPGVGLLAATTPVGSVARAVATVSTTVAIELATFAPSVAANPIIIVDPDG